jgi:hypothetical protein
MKPRAKRWMLSLTIACALQACVDQATTEPGVGGPTRSTLSSTQADVVRLLKRTDRLGEALTATEVIGPKGGRIQIPGAGLRIDFPRGAVRHATRITVTAMRGGNVAYRFEPHGIEFEQPVAIRQSLHNTTAWGDAAFAAELQGSYFERLLVDETESFARSLERRPGRVKGAGRFLEFSIEHFSGYMVSTGKVPVEVPIEIDITTR